MGQRLVINIIKDGERVMNIYQHWNGYTIGALMTVANILNKLKDEEKRTSVPVIAQNICKILDDDRGDVELNEKLYAALNINPDSSHSGMNIEDWKNEDLRKEMGIPMVTDRNIGILSFSKKEMDDSLDIAAAIADIDLDNMLASVPFLFFLLDKEDAYELNPSDTENAIPYPDDFPDLEEWLDADAITKLADFLVDSDSWIYKYGDKYLNICE